MAFKTGDYVKIYDAEEDEFVPTMVIATIGSDYLVEAPGVPVEIWSAGEVKASSREEYAEYHYTGNLRMDHRAFPTAEAQEELECLNKEELIGWPFLVERLNVSFLGHNRDSFWTPEGLAEPVEGLTDDAEDEEEASTGKAIPDTLVRGPKDALMLVSENRLLHAEWFLTRMNFRGTKTRDAFKALMSVEARGLLHDEVSAGRLSKEVAWDYLDPSHHLMLGAAPAKKDQKT